MEVDATQIVELLVIHYYITRPISLAGKFTSSDDCLPSNSRPHCLQALRGRRRIVEADVGNTSHVARKKGCFC